MGERGGRKGEGEGVVARENQMREREIERGRAWWGWGAGGVPGWAGLGWVAGREASPQHT
jgi:hypothetical protein